MKKTKLLYIITTFLLIYGCTSSSDSSGTTNSSVIPLAPLNLYGTAISPNQINLEWYINSTNETGFKIERRITGGDFTLVGTVNSGISTFSDVGLIPNTNYLYRVYAFNDAGNSNYSNSISVSTPNLQLPQVIISNITSITSISATSVGTITNDGNANVTERGVVWSTSSMPTINLLTRTSDGNGLGSFTSSITGLLPNTTYYLRAYAYNQLGYAYSSEVSFTTLGPTVSDIDGNVYETATFCGKTWTKTNLNVSHYRNGDVIPQVSNPTQLASLTTGAWCYYNNDSANGPVYGKLYNWYAVTDPRGLAPLGYHIPSYNEWDSITTCIGINKVFGYRLKENGTAHWNTSFAQGFATNSTGFTGLPGGYWPIPSTSYGNGVNFDGKWWSSSVHPYPTSAWAFSLFFDNDSQHCNPINTTTCLSVRCLKD